MPYSGPSFDKVELRFTANTVDWADLEDAVEKLSLEFREVAVVREPAGPMVSNAHETAIYILVGTTALSFLKSFADPIAADVYSFIKKSIHKLYLSTKAEANSRAGYGPLAITVAKGTSTISFYVPRDLSEGVLGQAFATIPEALEKADGNWHWYIFSAEHGWLEGAHPAGYTREEFRGLSSR